MVGPSVGRVLRPERSKVATAFPTVLNGYLSNKARMRSTGGRKGMNKHTIGVDISKAHLDAYRSSDEAHRRFGNDAAGFRALIDWIGESDDPVIYEPTGVYHGDFERALHAAGAVLVKVNPLRARRFAQAAGLLAKTDELDARHLAMMGQALNLRRTSAHPPRLAELKELAAAREALLKDRVAVLNRLDRVRHGLLRRHNRARLRQIDGQLRALDARIGELVASDPSLSRRQAILTSIPGVGEVTARGLLSEMPELGALDAKSAASLAGLAPRTRQSGQWRGRAWVHGGRRRVRCMMYMAALAAMRCNPDLRRKYRQLTAAGKPPKVAITAIMRKLIVLANALLADDREWMDRAAPTSV